MADSQEPMEEDAIGFVADGWEPLEVNPSPAWLPWNVYTMPALPLLAQLAQPGLEHFQQWGIHDFSGQPVPVSHHKLS